MKNTWNVVHDRDGENGKPTCWTKEVNHKRYGKHIWITQNEYGMFDIEACANDFYTLKTCKSLTSARRWVATNLF